MHEFTYPHTIDNGAGERLTFLRRVPSAHGERLEGENLVRPGSGPPMHVHYHQTEGFTVLQGLMAYQRLGEPVQYAKPGDSVEFARGEAHKFWNAGSDDLRCSAWLEPADNIEYFLGAVFDSQKRSGNGRPRMIEAAYLTWLYRSEFKLLEVPDPVQRFVFPLIIALCTPLGLFRRYRNAPTPRYR